MICLVLGWLRLQPVREASWLGALVAYWALTTVALTLSAVVWARVRGEVNERWVYAGFFFFGTIFTGLILSAVYHVFWGRVDPETVAKYGAARGGSVLFLFLPGTIALLLALLYVWSETGRKPN